MKLSPEQMTKAVSGIDRLIGTIPKQSQQTIKGVFFLLIFGFVIGGAVYGIIMGKEAAVIKSAPIIENTNEAFEMDIKREREGGNFTSMLDAEVINEMKKIDAGKIQFPSRANMEPEADRGIIEPPSGRKVRESPDIQVQDPLFEGDYKSKPSIESDVRPLEKRKGPDSGNRESVMDSEKKEVQPLPDVEPKHRLDVRERNSEVRPLEKKRPGRGTDMRSPKPLYNNSNEGIIGE
jgi:hypothetical protein